MGSVGVVSVGSGGPWGAGLANTGVNKGCTSQTAVVGQDITQTEDRALTDLHGPLIEVLDLGHKVVKGELREQLVGPLHVLVHHEVEVMHLTRARWGERGTGERVRQAQTGDESGTCREEEPLAATHPPLGPQRGPAGVARLR